MITETSEIVRASWRDKEIRQRRIQGMKAFWQKTTALERARLIHTPGSDAKRKQTMERLWQEGRYQGLNDKLKTTARRKRVKFIQSLFAGEAETALAGMTNLSQAVIAQRLGIGRSRLTSILTDLSIKRELKETRPPKVKYERKILFDQAQKMGLLEALNDKARTVLKLRYGMGGPLKLREIKPQLELKVSNEAIRQIEQKALAKLSNLISPEQT